MNSPALHPQAKVAFVLAGLYNAAEALCQVFVSVYFWRNSHDLMVLCWYYLALYAVTPVVFLLAGPERAPCNAEQHAEFQRVLC